jgi:drug/metabolite transporter (DMT)-like permease
LNKLIISQRNESVFLLAYGFWIAFAYLGLVILEPGHLVATFAVSSLIGGVLVALPFTESLSKIIRDPFSWLRSVFFALTQIFMFRALTAGDTTAAFCASSGALVVVLLLAKHGLHERIGAREWSGAVLAIFGLVLLAPRLGVTVNGIAAGVFQAASIVAARKAGIRGQSISGNLAHGLLVAGLLCLPLCWSDLQVVGKSPMVLIISALLILFTQFYFLWISFRYPSSQVSQVSQSRIAWSLVLNAVWFHRFPTLQAFCGASIVLGAALLVVSSSRRSVASIS